MLINTNFSGESLNLSASDQRKKDQIKADFAEYLKTDEPEEVLKKMTNNGVQSKLEYKIEQLK